MCVLFTIGEQSKFIFYLVHKKLLPEGKSIPRLPSPSLLFESNLQELKYHE